MLWVTRGKEDRREDPKTRVMEGLRNKLWEENGGKVVLDRDRLNWEAVCPQISYFTPLETDWRIRD